MTVISATRILIAVCLFGVALAANPGEAGYCQPGQSFQQDCNTCTCTADGRNAACTLKACIAPPSPYRQKRNSPPRKPGEEGYCTPGESFQHQDGCNTCRCTPDGKNAYCTLIGCTNIKLPESVAESKQKRSVPRGKPGEEGYCTPGESFKDEEDCNTCHCTADGKNAYCTEMACIKSPPVESKQKRDARQKKPGEEGYCTPGESFKDELDCNTCHCTDDGKNAICTEMICDKPQTPVNSKQKRDAPAPNTPGFSCQPGSTFKYECNDCTCSSDGKTAGCTYKLCSPGSYRRRRQASGKQQGDEGYCTPGETYKDKCNTCKCSPDGKTAACTFALCPEGTYRRKRQAGNECQAGQTTKQDCNTCSCANGHWVCTLKACLKKRAADCQDGETKKEDCNTCKCVQGGWACTKIGCPTKQKRQAECSDGQTKQEDCNTCRCIQGGWACTRKFCPKAKRQAECSDGQTKQEDCNTCRCVQGGWACTRKFCPKIKRQAECSDGQTKQQDCNSCNCIHGQWACTRKACPKVKRDVEN